MKLADNHTPQKLPNNAFYEYFKTDLENVIHAMTPDLNSNQMQWDKDIAYYNVKGDFFETTYIPIFADTRLGYNNLPDPINCTLPNELKNRCGLIERDILSFVYNGEDVHCLIITGKKGWGKTTLLRFISAYAIPKLNNIPQNYICNSLYISFNTQQNHNAFTTEMFDTILLNNVRKFCSNRIGEDISSPFYQYLLNKSTLSREKIKYDDIIKELNDDLITAQEAQVKLSSLRKDILDRNDELLVLTGLEYFNYDTEHSIIPLLIVDDLDPFPTEIQVHAYEKIFELAHDYHIKVIMAMRPRSYECVVEHTFDTIPTDRIMKLEKPNFENYLLSKLNKVKTKYKDGVLVSEHMTFSVKTMKNFFSYYTDVLTQKDALEFLIMLSDGDIRTFSVFVICSNYKFCVFLRLQTECKLKNEEMTSVKGTKTEKNLLTSFAGESQARMRYTYFASKAKKEGFEQIAAIFEETANQEKEHAERMFKYLEGGKVEITASYPAGVIGTTAENLLAAAKGEHEEWSHDYPMFADVAEEEGFHEIASMYRNISVAEKGHEERYLKFLSNVECGSVFVKDREITWQCRNCGFIYVGKAAPQLCPACKHPQSYFEIMKANY